MTKLILIRHGETIINTVGKLHFTNDKENLTKKGVAQMEAVAFALKELNPQVLYCSKSLRAEESAKILTDKLGIQLKSVMGLEERDWGDFSGESWSEVEAVLKNMSSEERYLYVPPRGESWKDTESRLVGAVLKILQSNEDKTVAIVSHGGAIRILMPYLLNLPKEETFKYNPDIASITIFDYKKGKFTKQLVNDTSHLKNIK